jgi:hypothetical protein
MQRSYLADIGSTGGGMDSRADEFGGLEHRLAKLEKQNRRFKQFGVVALIVPVLLVVMGQTTSKKTIEANEFVLRDDSGHVRARLSTATLPSGDPKTSRAQFVLFDTQGSQRTMLDSGFSGSLIGAGGAALTLTDGNGKDKVYISADNNQGGILSLLDQKGLPGAVLTTLSAVLPGVNTKELILHDESGNIRARLFVTEKGATNMAIPGLTQSVPVTLNPKPMLALYDEKGQVGGMLDDDSISFAKSHVSLFGGVLSIGDQTSAVVVSRYSVGIFDEQGYEATLGRRALVTPRTGETQMTSAASLLLFDKNKNVIWKAP